MNESDKQIMDGCTAATHIAYALSEIATIYPITPIASMGETADKWALHGRLNIWGRPMEVKEMERDPVLPGRLTERPSPELWLRLSQHHKVSCL